MKISGIKISRDSDFLGIKEFELGEERIQKYGLEDNILYEKDNILICRLGYFPLHKTRGKICSLHKTGIISD